MSGGWDKGAGNSDYGRQGKRGLKVGSGSLDNKMSSTALAFPFILECFLAIEGQKIQLKG